MRLLVRLIVVLFACLAVPAIAHAQASDPATDRAKAHFSTGVKLFDQKPPDYEGALAEFRAAYAEKPTPFIKQNIALCLRALRRYGEAIDALEQFLAEGGDSVKPETRAAARKAIDEMSALVATVRVRVVVQVGAGTPAPPPNVEVAIDGFAVPPDAVSRPIRLGPGEHTFTAHARGFSDALRRVKLTAGQRELPIDLELQPSASATGRMHVKSTLAGATISIDGVPLAIGEWSGDVSVGAHHVEVTSPGMVAYGADVNVAGGSVTEVQANMGERLSGDAPPPVDGPKPTGPAVERKWYIAFGLDVLSGSRTQTIAMDERLESTRSYTGANLVVKGGRGFGNHLVIEAFGWIGAYGPRSYRTQQPSSGSDTSVSATSAAIGPELRLRSSGKTFRAIGGMGFGVDFESVTLRVPGKTAQTGSGTEGVFVGELGAQLNVSSRVFFDAAGLVDVYGVGAIKSGSSRYYSDSPALRAGVRVLLGIML